MFSRSPIYRVRSENAAELERVLRICMAGMRMPAALTYPGGVFADWARRQFFPVLQPHAVAVHRMVQSGDAKGVVAADAAITLPSASTEAGRDLLSRREGARHLPVTKRLLAAVASGEMPGHFITVLAVQAADFSIGELPLLQCALYCEWHTAQPAGSPRSLADFVVAAAELLEPEEKTLPAVAGRLRAI